MTSTRTDPSTRTARPAGRGIWRAGLVAALVAAVLTTLVWLLGQLTPATWEVAQGGTTQAVLAPMPAVASVVGIAVGTLALWLLVRVPRGVTVWTVLAVVAGLGSVVSPLAAAADGWTGALLALMHVVVLGVALVVLRPAGLRGRA
ncbi:DUF6069 family protein [Aquipuribacter hungaricus]|uniref:DUF6069 family protein n=1 Tax=Aquipuribacter hungaricus TaxID=545624 RepID=A0ABV7WJG1_9MICO